MSGPSAANQADEDEYAGELAEESRDVGLNGQGFKVDHAQKELAIEDAELERQESASYS